MAADKMDLGIGITIDEGKLPSDVINLVLFKRVWALKATYGYGLSFLMEIKRLYNGNLTLD